MISKNYPAKGLQEKKSESFSTGYPKREREREREITFGNGKNYIIRQKLKVMGFPKLYIIESGTGNKFHPDVSISNADKSSRTFSYFMKINSSSPKIKNP